MASDTQKVIATAGLISVGVGSANAVFKFKRRPSTRFLIGSGIAYLILSAMGNSDTLGEIAKGLALGIMTTIIMGEGGGLASYFLEKEAEDTRRPGADREDLPPQQQRPRRVVRVGNPNGQFRPDQTAAQPFHPNR